MRKYFIVFCFFYGLMFGNMMAQQQEYTAGLPEAIPGAAINVAPTPTEPPAPDPFSVGVPMAAPTTAAAGGTTVPTPVAQPFPPATQQQEQQVFPAPSPGSEQFPLPAQQTFPAAPVTAPVADPFAQTQAAFPAAPVTTPVADPFAQTQATFPAAPVTAPVADPFAQPQATFPAAPATVSGYASGYPAAPVTAPAAIPTLPAAPQSVPFERLEPDKPTAQAAVPSELKGIDTLDVEEAGGNWLIKRRWWEKASEKIEKMEDEVDRIMDARMEFFSKRDKADSELLDPFYLEVGIDQGKLEEIIDFLFTELKEKKEKMATLSVEERKFIKTLEQQKKLLKQMKANVDAIRKVDDAIDAAITQLVEQINKARSYKKEARGHFKEIGDVLDDNKARELFYKMEAAWQNIKAIGQYIFGDFSSHFDEIISIAKKQIEQIKKDLDELEQKGISFKQQLKKFEDDAEKEKEKQEALERQAELEAELEEMEQQRLGWFETILSYLLMPIDWIRSWWEPSDQEVLEEVAVEMPTPVPSKEVFEVPEVQEAKEVVEKQVEIPVPAEPVEAPRPKIKAEPVEQEIPVSVPVPIKPVKTPDPAPVVQKEEPKQAEVEVKIKEVVEQPAATPEPVPSPE